MFWGLQNLGVHGAWGQGGWRDRQGHLKRHLGCHAKKFSHNSGGHGSWLNFRKVILVAMGYVPWDGQWINQAGSYCCHLSKKWGESILAGDREVGTLGDLETFMDRFEEQLYVGIKEERRKSICNQTRPHGAFQAEITAHHYVLCLPLACKKKKTLGYQAFSELQSTFNQRSE